MAPGGTNGQTFSVRRLRHEAGMALARKHGVECRFNLVFTGDVGQDTEGAGQRRKSGYQSEWFRYNVPGKTAAIVEPSLTAGCRVTRSSAVTVFNGAQP